MRGLGRLAATPSASGKQTLISSSAVLSYSTFSPLGGSGGGGGGGRGRGRGALPSPPSAATGDRVPGKPYPDAEDGDNFAPTPGLGHGRGHPVVPSSPVLPSFSSWIKSQEEWEEAVKETMEKVPRMKELMDMYCGPDRVTAKQQQEELRRVANTLPENIPSSVKRFTDRALLSLQSNPGWGWDKKCQFMDKLVWEVSQHYK